MVRGNRLPEVKQSMTYCHRNRKQSISSGRVPVPGGFFFPKKTMVRTFAWARFFFLRCVLTDLLAEIRRDLNGKMSHILQSLVKRRIWGSNVIFLQNGQARQVNHLGHGSLQ